MAVFVERALTARKGKKRVALQLRVHAPEAHGGHFRCRAELHAGDVLVWPSTPDFAIAGGDAWQALVLALRVAAQSLVLFERTSDLRIDPGDWMDIVDLLPDTAIPAAMRPRIAEIERAIAAAHREYHETHEHAHEHEHEHGPARRARRTPRRTTRKR